MPVRAHSTPTTTIATRQLTASVSPQPTSVANSSGIANCVTPPPKLPHPAAVALAVPTQLGANIRDV
jgi:hypothetical protein